MKFNTLLIDDNQVSLKAIKDMLNNINSIEKVSVANNYFEAINFIKHELENNTFNIDLILLDFDMLTINGFEILKNLQDINLDDVLIVAMSTNIQNKKTSLQRGVVDFLHKPFDLEELQSVINKISNIYI